jgi:hypothetical protein
MPEGLTRLVAVPAGTYTDQRDAPTACLREQCDSGSGDSTAIRPSAPARTWPAASGLRAASRAATPLRRILLSGAIELVDGPHLWAIADELGIGKMLVEMSVETSVGITVLGA